MSTKDKGKAQRRGILEPSISGKEALKHMVINTKLVLTSPNEAPKGDTPIFSGWGCAIEGCGVVIFNATANQIKAHKKEHQPPAPDKEWELRFDEEFGDLGGYQYPKEMKKLENNVVAFLSIKSFIRQLLKAKDQEADRRVAEVIKKIQKEIEKTFIKSKWKGQKSYMIDANKYDAFKLSLKGE